MKIVITESQLKLLKLINENEDVLNQFKTRINAVNNGLNKLYTDINFITLAELLNNEINIDLFSSRYDNLDKEYNKISTEMDKYFNSFGEDAYFDKWVSIHDNLDDINYNNQRKLDVISLILSNLESLINDSKETSGLFSDIRTVNLS